MLYFTVDTIYPIPSIFYPVNISYTYNITEINYTFVEINPDSCWYSLDEGQNNITITQGETDSPGSWTERIAHWDTPYAYTRINNYDADPESTTDPLDTDTDNDGLSDGWTDGWIYKPEVERIPLTNGQTYRDIGYWRYNQ